MDIVWLTILRLLVPLTIIKWPLFGMLASASLDIQDWHWYTANKSNDISVYHGWDKLLDIYYLGIAALVSLTWKEVRARITSVLLFGYRLFGFFLFLLTGNQLMFFLFPNIFEHFFLFYVALSHFMKKKQLLTTFSHTIIILLIVGIPKLIQEYFLHVVKKFPWEVLTLPFFENYSFWVWMFFYVSVPAGLLLWVEKSRRLF